MENKTTIRLYFESGTKIKGLSFWKNLWDNNFAPELIKRAKEAGLEQAICFNVTSGYLNNLKIQFNNTEVKSIKLPQCVEITDTNVKIEKFLLEEKVFLSDCTVLMVKSEMVLKP
jgi:PII-like signaling protein